MVTRRLASLVFVLMLAACGGGVGGSSSLPPTQAAAPGGGTTPLSGATQNVSVSLAIPAAAASTAGAVRKPLYISTQTKSASIAVNGGPPVIASLVAGSNGCSAVTGGGLTCTITIAAPVGSDTFAVTLYPTTNGTGSPLSTGSMTQTIVAGTANSVSLTLSGIIASIVLSLNPASPAIGAAAAVAVNVTAKDAAGAAIVGGDAFATPIALTDSDTSGATKLSKSTLLSPSDFTGLTLSYSGAAIGSATIGASAGSVSAPPVTLTPQTTTTTVHFNDYTTFGYDNQRDVYNPNSTAITPASMANLRLAWQTVLNGSGDFNTQSQPILATEIPGHSGVLVVGSGGSGNVYALDATTGQQLWKTPTGLETFVCQGGYHAQFGSGGTAAYDPATRSLYIVGNSNIGGGNAPGTNTLYHLDAASGSVIGKVDFASPDANWPSLDFSHVSVTLQGQTAYVGTGATCDIPSWRGRIVAIDTTTMTVLKTFYTIWNGSAAPYSGGGVWGWGGVAIDYQGNVLAGVGNATDSLATNNGAISAPFQYAPSEQTGLGDAVVKMPASLAAPIESNHPIPSTMFYGESVDLDMNGTPLIATPNGAGCDPVAAVQGKSGELYVFDELNITAGPRAQFDLSLASYKDGFLGGPAYSPATGLLYAVSTSNYLAPATTQTGSYAPGLVAIQLGCNSTPQILWHSAFGPDAYTGTTDPGQPRSVPAVSAGGVVFVGTQCFSDGAGGCTGSVSPSPTLAARSAAASGARRKPLVCCAPPSGSTPNGAVWALDASTGKVLNNGLPIIITTGALRAPVTIDGNWLYVMDTSGNLYGLTVDPSTPAVSETLRRSDARTTHAWESAPRRI